MILIGLHLTAKKAEVMSDPPPRELNLDVLAASLTTHSRELKERAIGLAHLRLIETLLSVK
jgi:hypothetical protein